MLTTANASARILSKRCLSSSSSTPSKLWNVYLSGEIHSDWREVIANGVQKKELPVHLTSPNTSHEDSDDCGKIWICRVLVYVYLTYISTDLTCAYLSYGVGAIILGMEEKRPNWDKIGANMNNVRTKKLIKDADVVVVRFGEKYRQWNAVCYFWCKMLDFCIPDC